MRLTYDKLGRVLTHTEPEDVTTFEYDSDPQGIGQTACESSGDFVRSYFYDRLSRPVSMVESHGFHSFAVSRSYDGYGRPKSLCGRFAASQQRVTAWQADALSSRGNQGGSLCLPALAP